MPLTLLQRARAMRQNPTPAENLLWQFLRRKEMGGFKFRRQHIVLNPETGGEYGNFILDFYCHEKKLAIELDGGGHAESEQMAYDQARTQALQTLGIRELRFWNREIFENLEGVLETIWNKLHDEQEKP